MTHLVAVYKPKKSDGLPPRRFEVAHAHKNLIGVRWHRALLVGHKQEIPDAARLIRVEGSSRAQFGEAAYRIKKGGSAWLEWYRPPGADHEVWVDRLWWQKYG